MHGPWKERGAANEKDGPRRQGCEGTLGKVALLTMRVDCMADLENSGPTHVVISWGRTVYFRQISAS
eukprot:4771819-Pyramimonas_sp.AAC.1